MSRGLFKVSYGTVKNLAAEKLYAATSIDLTKPGQIYAIINRRCVSKCLLCDSWREKDPPELDAAVWIKFLASTQRFNPYYTINFTGGEPLYKKDFLDIMEYCSDHGIMAGFTTNGMLLNKTVVDRLMRMDLFNIHISIDSMNEAVHDKFRGVTGVLKKVKLNLAYLLEQKETLKNTTPIMIKTNVFKDNLDDLEGVVKFCADNKMAGVIFQPILKWNKACDVMYQVDKTQLLRTISRLVEMIRAGFPILHTESQVMAWADHFAGRSQPRKGLCPVALRDLTIQPDGSIMLCDLVESTIGNIQTDEISEIWYSEQTRELRKKLIHCTGYCTSSGAVRRNLKEYLKLFNRLRVSG